MKPYVFFIGMVLLACSKKEINTPDTNVLSRETMIALLIEMHLLEASTMQVAITDTLVSPKAYNGYLQIFSKFKTTKQEFEKAIDYYCQDGEQMEIIMQAVVDSLTIRNSKR